MRSTKEDKLVVAYKIVINTVTIRTTLPETVHLQPPTPIRVEYFTYTGFSNDTIKQKVTKSINV